MSLYRNITWYMKGLKEYTKSGYEDASKYFNQSDLNVNLSGKNCMITGANSGLGKSCALQFSKLGAKIYLVCRDKCRGEEAQKEILSETKNENVVLHLLDMSNPKNIYEFGKNFSSSGEKLDILVNNAGCMVNELTRNADNLEMNFATNTLGTYILTESLIESLQRSSDPRVIVVSSGGMLVQKLDITDLNYEKRSAKDFDGTMIYAQNKRQQVVMTNEWATKYKNIKFFSMHPGWADTPAVASSMPSFYEKHKNKLRTVEQGSDTIVWLGASEAASKQNSGAFFQDRKEVSQHLPLAFTRSSRDENQKLMELLEKYRTEFTS